MKTVTFNLMIFQVLHEIQHLFQEVAVIVSWRFWQFTINTWTCNRSSNTFFEKQTVQGNPRTTLAYRSHAIDLVGNSLAVKKIYFLPPPVWCEGTKYFERSFFQIYSVNNKAF